MVLREAGMGKFGDAAGMAIACVNAFIEAEFEGGRHQRRVDQLSQILQETD